MKNTKTTLLIVTTMMVAIIAGYFYGLSYVSSLADKTILGKQDVEVAQIKFKHLSNLDKTSKENKDKSTQLRNIVLGSTKTIDFVTSIESVADDMNLNYDTNSIDIKQNNDLTAQNKELLYVVFSVSGTWRNVFNFVKYIETLPNIVKLESVKLISSDRVVSDSETVRSVSTPVATTPATTGTSTASSSSATSVVANTQVQQTRSSIWSANITFSIIKEK